MSHKKNNSFSSSRPMHIMNNVHCVYVPQHLCIREYKINGIIVFSTGINLDLLVSKLEIHTADRYQICQLYARNSTLL